jgi:hypothetical protein
MGVSLYIAVQMVCPETQHSAKKKSVSIHLHIPDITPLSPYLVQQLSWGMNLTAVGGCEWYSKKSNLCYSDSKHMDNI